MHFNLRLIINNRRKEFPTIGKIARELKEEKLGRDSERSEPERLSNNNTEIKLPGR